MVLSRPGGLPRAHPAAALPGCPSSASVMEHTLREPCHGSLSEPCRWGVAADIRSGLWTFQGRLPGSMAGQHVTNNMRRGIERCRWQPCEGNRQIQKAAPRSFLQHTKRSQHGNTSELRLVSVTTSMRTPVGDGFADRAPSSQVYSGGARRALSGSDVPPSGWASLTIAEVVIHR